jgi:hypothetical protein
MIKTYTTVAQEAERELDTLLGHENRIYKPWQLENHQLEPIRLIATTDEMLMLTFANAYVRPHFGADDSNVTIPSFFCKLNGATEGFLLDVKAKSKQSPEHFAVYNGFSKVSRKPKTSYLNKKPKWFDDQNGIDVEAALVSGIESIKFLKPNYQRQYLKAINRVLDVLRTDTSKIPNIGNRLVLETLLYNSKPIISMLHSFDFQYLVPKFVVIDDHKKRPNEFAAIRLLLMHSLSFDVFIVSDEGFSSIENFISDTLYSSHILTPKDFIYSEVLTKRSKLLSIAKWLLILSVLITLISLVVFR